MTAATRVVIALSVFAMVTMGSNGADRARAQHVDPRVTWYSGGHARVVEQAETASAIARDSDKALTEAKDGPLLIITEARVEQLRQRQRAIEIVYEPGVVRSVLGREVTVSAVIVPFTGDIRKGIILCKSVGASAPPWGAVDNLGGVEALEATVRKAGLSR